MLDQITCSETVGWCVCRLSGARVWRGHTTMHTASNTPHAKCHVKTPWLAFNTCKPTTFKLDPHMKLRYIRLPSIKKKLQWRTFPCRSTLNLTQVASQWRIECQALHTHLCYFNQQTTEEDDNVSFLFFGNNKENQENSVTLPDKLHTTSSGSITGFENPLLRHTSLQRHRFTSHHCH